MPAFAPDRSRQLSMTLFSIIGGFWLLDSLKDTVLEGTVGLEYQPRAKLLSVAVTLLLVIQYNRLVDSCSKPTVSVDTSHFSVPQIVYFLLHPHQDTLRYV